MCFISASIVSMMLFLNYCFCNQISIFQITNSNSLYNVVICCLCLCYCFIGISVSSLYIVVRIISDTDDGQIAFIKPCIVSCVYLFILFLMMFFLNSKIDAFFANSYRELSAMIFPVYNEEEPPVVNNNWFSKLLVIQL